MTSAAPQGAKVALLLIQPGATSLSALPGAMGGGVVSLLGTGLLRFARVMPRGLPLAKRGGASFQQLRAYGSAVLAAGSSTAPITQRFMARYQAWMKESELLTRNKQKVTQLWREFKTAAVVNSITLSQDGQALLAAILPAALLVQLMPHRFSSLAYSVRTSEQFLAECKHSSGSSKRKASSGGQSSLVWSVLRACGAAVLAALAAAIGNAGSVAVACLDELLVVVRGLYLMLLFAPALCTAALPGLLGSVLSAPSAMLRAMAGAEAVAAAASEAEAAAEPLCSTSYLEPSQPANQTAEGSRSSGTAGPGPSSCAQQQSSSQANGSLRRRKSSGHTSQQQQHGWRLQAARTAQALDAAPETAHQLWLDLLKWTLERAGPAFIKWGQWASTRPDLFPEDVCSRLEQLQTGAPSHSGSYSRSAVKAAFGKPVEELFSEFDEAPVASGSIAQIHRAVLSAAGAEGTGYAPGTVVAVKVRHPGVSDIMHRDFILMMRAAALCSRLPGLADLRLEESVRQFGGPLKEQLDLSIEAEHLRRFNANFASWEWANVVFPQPLFPHVSPSVLVESFEEGNLISRYVREPHRLNVSLARGGVSLFLKMMLRDNFIHADLHPGNILVREAHTPEWLRNGGSVGRLAAHTLALLPRRLRALLPQAVVLDFEPRIVLLDTGMIVTLSQSDKDSLMGFFSALTRLDGERLARSILQLSEGGDGESGSSRCRDPEAFVQRMRDMFAQVDTEELRLNTQAVFKDMLDTIRQHQVTLRSAVSTVVVTTLVLEGWSSKLDPEIRIMDMMRDLLAADWKDRISLTVDKIMSAGALAVA